MRRPLQRRLRAPKPATVVHIQQKQVPLLQQQQQQRQKEEADKEEAIVYDLSSSPDELKVMQPSSSLLKPPLSLPSSHHHHQFSTTSSAISNQFQQVQAQAQGGGGGGSGSSSAGGVGGGLSGGVTTKLIVPALNEGGRGGYRSRGGSRGGRGRRGGGRGGGDAGYGAEFVPLVQAGPFRPVSRAGGAGVASSGPPTTVDGYFGNSHCELCGVIGGKDIGAVLCRDCASDSQRSTFILQQRLQESQRSYANIVSICMACTGIRDPRPDIGAAACDSLACPILYDRHKIGLETAHIQAVLEDL
jgi:hypothetical protein